MELHMQLFIVSIFIMMFSVFSFKIDTKHPIIYEDVLSKPSSPTYFGYSVIINTEGDHWIHIGAPRANSSHEKNVLQPGTVYQCHIGERCAELKLNGKANWRYIYKESKENAWIGVSMSLMNSTGESSVVVCGHRWKDIKYKGHIMMPGVCYVIPVVDKETKGQCKLTPLVDDVQYILTYPKGKKKYRIYGTGVSQAGISSHCPKNSSAHQLILGAPGGLNWQGSIVPMHVPEEKNCEGYTSDTHYPNLHNETSYFGYSVSSGHLFSAKNLVYVVSAPHAFQGRGMVLLYDYDERNGIKKIVEIEGTQLGEYFGASITTADINQDNYDDLIIGAPRYSTESASDQGRIYIYLGGERINREMEYVDGDMKHAQFGTTVTTVGDVNNDGFQDIAVGAPHSNDNRGSVYIYFGGKSGLSQGQVIEAADVSSSLRGFGISVHYTAETCKREQAYMAIGAYLSGHAVVLKNYPAITLHMKLNSTVKTLAEGVKQFTINACSWYEGKCGPPQINVSRSILLDPEYYRIYFEDGVNTREIAFKQEIILQENQWSCEQFTISFKAGQHNRDHSIVIKASLLLNDSEGKPSTVVIKTDGTMTGTDTFCRNCSVVNQQLSKLTDTLEIPFTDCGVGEICDSELHLFCSFPQIEKGTFVIGSRSELKFFFQIISKKKPAHQVVLYVKIPEPVKHLRLNRECHETILPTETLLVCNIKSPLDSTNVENYTVEIDMSNLLEIDLPSLSFNAWLSATRLSNDSHNSCNVPVKLKSVASMQIIGKSVKEVVPYSNGTDVVFEQMYQVYKVGDSPVTKAETTLYVPYSLRTSADDENKFLSILHFQVNKGRYHIQCESDLPLPVSNHYAEMTDFPELGSLDTQLSRPKRDVTEDLVVKETNNDLYSGSSDKILHLNCSNMDVFCQQITCTSSFTDSKALLNIRLTLKVNISALGSVMKKKNIILFSTTGEVNVIEPKNLEPYESQRMDTVNTTTPLVPEAQEQKVAIWVIVVSAVCGILVLLVIVFVMLKAGFFQRKKKEKLQQLLAATIAEEFYYEKKTGPINSYNVNEDGNASDTVDGLE